MSTLRYLRAAELFRDLPDASLADLARLGRLRRLAPGEIVMRQGEAGEVVCVVGAGQLAVTVMDAAGQVRRVASLGPGQLAGEIQLLAGGERTATVTAETAAEVLELSGPHLDAAAERAPELMPRLMELVRRRLLHNLLAATLPAIFGTEDPALVDELEAGLEWVQLKAGESPFRQGDAGDAWYLVVSGRLRIVQTDADGEERVLSELGRGESLGELALLAELPRTATPYAIRDTVLARYPASEFHALLGRRPEALRAILRTVVGRAVSGAGRRAGPSRSQTIGLVATAPTLDLGALAERLSTELARLGGTLTLSARRLEELGVLAQGLPETHPSWLRFDAWLDERSDHHRFILLVGDGAMSTWTQRVVREADHVLLAGEAGSDPEPSPGERALLGSGPRHATRTLLLLHPPGTRAPTGTARWLDARPVDRHLHVRRDRPEDVARVARTVAGQALALVLGAGGARGFAHIGAVRALQQARIPIDYLGGTSAGALIGGMVAMGLGPDEMIELNRDMTALKPFGDYTFPVSSLLRGQRVEDATRLAFADQLIEDLWLPFFCTSCDISVFAECVHERGSLLRAVLASSALPGVLPPRLIDGHLHVDGGATQVLAGAFMRERSRGTLIAVDVSTERELRIEAERYPGGWSALWRRLTRKSEPQPPAIGELFMRAVSVGAANSTEAVARDADLFLRPPVEAFGTVQFDQMEVIERLGYEYARDMIARWSRPAAIADPL